MDRFIVGTGRCGSTLLSNMLGCNPALLSMSEFFSTLARDAVFAEGEFDGEEVVALLCRNNILNDLVMSRSPFIDAAAGHSIRREVGEYATRAPAFPGLKIWLSTLTPQVDALFGQATDFLRARPRARLADHYRALFEWLCARQGAQAWIERSGVSIEFVGRLIDWYPQARFLHIHRDGPINALAIRAFRHFVLYASFFSDPPTDAELDRALNGPIGSEDDPILRRMTRDIPPLEEFGRYWSWQIARGYHDLVRLPPSRFMDVRYEDLVADPRAVLARIAAFFDLPAGGDWIERAAAQVDVEAVEDRLGALTAAQRARLEQACRPGQVLTGRALDNPYEDSLIRARRAAQRVQDGT
ncbi:MAG: sulfotransferase [Gammaproteobacteria bacterium]